MNTLLETDKNLHTFIDNRINKNTYKNRLDFLDRRDIANVETTGKKNRLYLVPGYPAICKYSKSVKTEERTPVQMIKFSTPNFLEKLDLLLSNL